MAGNKKISLMLDTFTENGLAIMEVKIKKQGQFYSQSNVIRDALKLYFEKEGIVQEIQEKVAK